MSKAAAREGPSASDRITRKIGELGGWRGKLLARMRELIRQGDPKVVEAWKWMGTPVWSHDTAACAPANPTSRS
jgi:hypothetical protein